MMSMSRISRIIRDLKEDSLGSRMRLKRGLDKQNAILEFFPMSFVEIRMLSKRLPFKRI